MDIRLLALDIDGTIAGKSNQVSIAVTEAIAAAQAKGIQVAIATGRMYSSALRFHAAVGSNLPLVAYNGAWIQDPLTEKLHLHLPIPKTAALQLLAYFEQPEWISLLSIHVYLQDRLYVREITPTTEIYAQRAGIEPIAVGDLREAIAAKPTKLLALSKDSKVIQHLLDTLQKRYTPAELYLTQSVATFFEACHPRGNKGAGISYLTEKILNLKPENVMAIGDNFNDAEMLAYAGFSVAMGNAPENVQKMAHWVAPNVEEDGVATAIEKFLL